MMTFGDWNATGERIKALHKAEAQIAQQFTPAQQDMLGFEPPRFSGLQSGEVKDRWLDRQAPVDRWLFIAVWASAIGGLVALIGVALLTNITF